MEAKRLQLGPEHKDAAGPSIVERFLADAIAAKVQDAVSPVPKRKREHAIEHFNGGLEPPLRNRSQHDLGITMASKHRPRALQLAA